MFRSYLLFAILIIIINFIYGKYLTDCNSLSDFKRVICAQMQAASENSRVSFLLRHCSNKTKTFYRILHGQLPQQIRVFFLIILIDHLILIDQHITECHLARGNFIEKSGFIEDVLFGYNYYKYLFCFLTQSKFIL